MRRGSERTDVSFMLQVKHADSSVEVDGDEPPSFTLSSSEEELELAIVKVVHSRRLKACVFWLRPVCVCVYGPGEQGSICTHVICTRLYLSHQQ